MAVPHMTGKIFLGGAVAALRRMEVSPGLWRQFEASGGGGLLSPPALSTHFHTSSEQCGGSVSDLYAKFDDDPSEQVRAGVVPIYE